LVLRLAVAYYMSKNERLSIVTINYRNLEGLKNTFQSLLSQKNQVDFEWVVVDGKSEDGTKEWLGGLTTSFKMHFVSEADRGIYHAMNKGIEMASNGYVLFLNSGDIFFDASSVTLICGNISLHHPVDLILFGFRYSNTDRYPKPLWWRFWSLPTSHQAMIYSRSLLLKNKYNEKYSLGGDFEHFLRIAPQLSGFASVRELLSINEIYGSNKNMHIVQKEYEEILAAYMPPLVSNLLVNLKFFYLNLRSGSV
jgi:putative colanic acid biosynthesis glycosyltransferase